jgi:hypothetical protein
MTDPINLFESTWYLNTIPMFRLRETLNKKRRWEEIKFKFIVFDLKAKSRKLTRKNNFRKRKKP